MEIVIRLAEEKDLLQINKLLYQVHQIHSSKRPDIFKVGRKKYKDEELREILKDDKRPIFVAVNKEEVLGYAFCIEQQHLNSNSLTDIKTLYIDDLCVDSQKRGLGIGRSLYEWVLKYAKDNNYYNITLNVWKSNEEALKFYEKLGLEVQKIGMEKIL